MKNIREWAHETPNVADKDSVGLLRSGEEELLPFVVSYLTKSHVFNKKLHIYKHVTQSPISLFIKIKNKIYVSEMGSGWIRCTNVLGNSMVTEAFCSVVYYFLHWFYTGIAGLILGWWVVRIFCLQRKFQFTIGPTKGPWCRHLPVHMTIAHPISYRMQRRADETRALVLTCPPRRKKHPLSCQVCGCLLLLCKFSIFFFFIRCLIYLCGIFELYVLHLCTPNWYLVGCKNQYLI